MGKDIGMLAVLYLVRFTRIPTAPVQQNPHESILSMKKELKFLLGWRKVLEIPIRNIYKS